MREAIMPDTTDVIVESEFFDAGAGVYRRDGDVFATETPDAYDDLVTVETADEPTCAEGDCSRTVDEENAKCWQHDTDPETDGSDE